MSDGQMVEEPEGPIEETLRFLAELMESGNVHVDVFPSLLYEAADEIERLRDCLESQTSVLSGVMFGNRDKR
jgi:hypothetical protein